MFELIDILNFRGFLYRLDHPQVPREVFIAVGFALYIVGFSWALRFLGARLDIFMSRFLRRCGGQPILGLQDTIGGVLRWLPPLAVVLGIIVIISAILFSYVEGFEILKEAAFIVYTVLVV